MNRKKIVVSMLSLLIVLAAAGCGGKKEEEIPPVSTAEQSVETATQDNITQEAETSVQNTQDINAVIKEMELKDATPAEFIQLAKDKMADAGTDEKTALAHSVLNAQKKYLEKVISSYEEANSNPEFGDIYALDVTKDLADKITDTNIKKLVMDTYENGLILIKDEGYVYPIIDIQLYQENFMTNLSEADAAALEKEINEYNSGL